ncbi:MAG: phosphoenolpyruvate carboxykinase (GTP), partial [Oscillochloris sp.]|nr:phosphoenolpyruvate carboxykinase (GTP) [Oscillochloris sp.]
QFGRGIYNPPRIFGVNWFRKDENGKFAWPGFGENMRVLKWIVQRSHGEAFSVESPIGWIPNYEHLDWRGLAFTKEQFNKIMSIDLKEWQQEVLLHEELFIKIYDRLPKELIHVRDLILSSLWRTPEGWGSNHE